MPPRPAPSLINKKLVELLAIKQHLPDSMLDIVEAIGWNAALTLVDQIGGIEFRFPDGILASKRKNWLIELIGEQPAAKLMRIYGGTRLYIPRCRAALLELRNHHFSQDMQQLIEQGFSKTAAVQQLAPRYQISERWAYRILATQSDKQRTLF